MALSVRQHGVTQQFLGAGMGATGGTGNVTDTADSPFQSAQATNSAAIWIQNAGAASGDYFGTISAVGSATAATVTPNIGTTVTNTKHFQIGDCNGTWNGSTSFTYQFPASTVAGNCLFLKVQTGNGTTVSAGNVTDTFGNTWVSCGTAVNDATTGYNIACFRVLSNKSSGSLTVTIVTSATPTFLVVSGLELNGAGAGTWVQDVYSTKTGTTGTTMTSNTFSTLFANEIIIGVAAPTSHVSTDAVGYTAYPTWDMDNGSAGVHNDSNGGNDESKIVTTIQSSVTFSASQGTSGAWDLLVISFAFLNFPIDSGVDYTVPARTLHPSRDGTQTEAWLPRVAPVAAPTEAYTSYPDTMRQGHRLHLEPAVFRPNAPERTSPYSDQDFPDRVLRAKTAPDHFPSGFQGTVDDAGVDWSFPDTVSRAQPRSTDWWTTSGLPITSVPTEAYWSYPDRLVRATTGPDWWTLAGKPEERVPYASTDSYPDRLVRATTAPDGWTLAGRPERTAPYSDQDFPDRVIRARTAPDWSPTVGRPERTAPYSDQDFPDRVLRAKTAPDWSPTLGAPERTAPYSDQDFPDRVLRARTGPDDHTLWPLPLPTLVAPTEGYWSYPDKVIRATTAPDAWTTVQRPERTAPYSDQDFPDRVLRARTATDWSPTVGRPEETAPLASQSYQDRFPRPVPAPDWSPTTGRPDERLPAPWANYPDQVLRARGGPDNVTVAQMQIRPPPAWWWYPDTVLGRPYPTTEQMVESLWVKPIPTPSTPTWYPDVVLRAPGTVPWDQAFPPQTIVPTARFIVWLGPKPIIVPVLVGSVIQPVMGGQVLVPVLGKTTV